MEVFRSAVAGLCTHSSLKARQAEYSTVCSKSLKKLPVVILFVVTAVAAAAVGGWLGGVVPKHAETSITSHDGGTRTRLQLLMTQQQPSHMYPVLSNSVWLKSAWGKNCSTPTSQLSPGRRALCQLPSIWKDCTHGVYLDVVSDADDGLGCHLLCWDAIRVASAAEQWLITPQDM